MDIHRNLTNLIRAISELPGLGFLSQFSKEIDEVGYKADAAQERVTEQRSKTDNVKSAGRGMKR